MSRWSTTVHFQVKTKCYRIKNRQGRWMSVTSFLIILSSCCLIWAQGSSKVSDLVRQILVPPSRQFCVSFRRSKDCCQTNWLEACWSKVRCRWRLGSRKRSKLLTMAIWARNGWASITAGWCLLAGTSRSSSPAPPVMSSVCYKCWHELCWSLTQGIVLQAPAVVAKRHSSTNNSGKMVVIMSSTCYRQAGTGVVKFLLSFNAVTGTVYKFL